MSDATHPLEKLLRLCAAAAPQLPATDAANGGSAEIFIRANIADQELQRPLEIDCGSRDRLKDRLKERDQIGARIRRI